MLFGSESRDLKTTACGSIPIRKTISFGRKDIFCQYSNKKVIYLQKIVDLVECNISQSNRIT